MDARGRHPRPRPVNDSGYRRVQVQLFQEVERRCPADLGVPRPVGGNVLDQLVGDARDRRRVLHQRDRQLEGLQELRLVCHLGRGLQSRGDRREVHPLVEAALACQLERRRRPQRPVEVEMQLRFWHPREETLESSPTVTRSYRSGPHRSEPRLGSR